MDAILSHPLSRKASSVKMRGLMKPVKKVFFKKFKKPVRSVKGGSSKKIGIKVHAQVETYVKTGVLPSRPHSYTLSILKFLKQKHLRHKISSEVPLLSLKGQFLTWSDLICEHTETGALTVISLKTGYSVGMHRGQLNTNYLPEVKNSYASQHQVQLALEVACIEHDYHVKVKEAYILYAGFGPKKQLKVVPLAKWAKTEYMQKHLLACMSKSVKAGKRVTL